MVTFSERFCKALQIRNINAADLSRITKIPEATISQYKKGLYEPKQKRLELVAKVLNVSVAWLMGYDDVEMEPHIKERPKGIKILVLGRVAAGIPLEANEEIIDYEEITPEMARQGEHFALQIDGDSMEPRMTKGDVVIVRKQPDVDSGKVAVVLINGQDATVKKVIKQETGICLVSTNPNYEPKFFNIEEIINMPITILGRVVELRAKF